MFVFSRIVKMAIGKILTDSVRQPGVCLVATYLVVPLYPRKLSAQYKCRFSAFCSESLCTCLFFFVLQGVIEFSLSLFFAKFVSYTFLYWLPNYICVSSMSAVFCRYCDKRVNCSAAFTVQSATCDGP